MQPFPLVPIESRRHVIANPVRTRFGVGDVRIDHAAGVPLGLRRSHLAPRSAPIPPSTDWDDQPNMHDAGRLRRQASYDEDDSPVVLPMRPRRTVLVIAATLVILFIAVCASIAFSGISATTLITHNASRTDVVPASAH
jgi:hypothetical protein